LNVALAASFQAVVVDFMPTPMLCCRKCFWHMQASIDQLQQQLTHLRTKYDGILTVLQQTQQLKQ
jgi:hypothetical protein